MTIIIGILGGIGSGKSTVARMFEKLGAIRIDADEIAREGARRMLAVALEAEAADYIARHQERDEHGRAQVVRNGKARARKVTIGSGAIESTCAQYQRRFKLTGQFWTLEGDEAFLALATLHRNRRWSFLFPHDQS